MVLSFTASDRCLWQRRTDPGLASPRSGTVPAAARHVPLDLQSPSIWHRVAGRAGRRPPAPKHAQEPVLDVHNSRCLVRDTRCLVLDTRCPVHEVRHPVLRPQRYDRYWASSAHNVQKCPVLLASFRYPECTVKRAVFSVLCCESAVENPVYSIHHRPCGLIKTSTLQKKGRCLVKLRNSRRFSHNIRHQTVRMPPVH